MVSFFEIFTLSLLLNQVLLIGGWIRRVSQTFISPVVLFAVSTRYSHITFDFVGFTRPAIVRSSKSLFLRLQLVGVGSRLTVFSVLFCRTTFWLCIFLLRSVLRRGFSDRGRRGRVVGRRPGGCLEYLAGKFGLLLKSRRYLGLRDGVLRKLRSRAGFGRQDDRWGFFCRLQDDILDAGVLWRCFGTGSCVCCGSFGCTRLRGSMVLWGHFHAGG